MENDSVHSIFTSQRSSQVDGCVGDETASGNGDESLRRAPEQVELQEECPTENRARRDTLEAKMNYQHNRRHFMRQVQKDIGNTINFYGVVLVLLISVTFTGFLQPPGGLDNVGFMKYHGHRVNRYIIYVYASFFLATAGIFVCMSCVAFVLPRNTKYARPTFTGEMAWTDPAAVDSNSVHQRMKMLDVEVKANDKIARTLKVAHIHEILANLFFVLSVVFASLAFVTSSLMVMNLEQKHKFSSAASSKAITWIIIVLAVLYIGLLLWQILIAVIDLIVDSIKLMRRLPVKLRSGVRFSVSDSILERFRNSQTRL